MSEYNTVDELMLAAGWGTGGWAEFEKRGSPPWKAGHELVTRGVGGVHVLGSRHVSIAGDSYATHVARDRNVRVDGNMDVHARDWQLTRIPDVGSGRQNLHVKGDMEWTTHNRMTIGTGTIDRIWHGPIAKLACLEGVICGGAWSRLYVGPSINIAVVNSSDVYGAAIRSSGFRGSLAAIGYRSSDYASWHMVAYNRHTQATLQPAVSSPGQRPQNPSKLARIAGLIAKIGTIIFPPLFIAWSILTFIPMLIISLVKYLDARFFAAPKKPELMIPRMLTRVVAGNEIAVRSSKVVL